MEPWQRTLLGVLGGLAVVVLGIAGILALQGDDGPPAAAPTTLTVVTAAPTSTEPSPGTGSPATTLPEETTTSSSTTTSSTTTPPSRLLTLAGDGLGAVDLGTESEAAIQALSLILGDADEDTGWIDSFSGFGTCPGDVVRGVRWGTLWTLHTDGATDWGRGGFRHIFSYTDSVLISDGSEDLGLRTAEGVGVGSTIDQLVQAYGSALDVHYEELIDSWVYFIDVPDPGFLWGLLSGSGTGSVVLSVNGGVGCGE